MTSKMASNATRTFRLFTMVRQTNQKQRQQIHKATNVSNWKLITQKAHNLLCLDQNLLKRGRNCSIQENLMAGKFSPRERGENWLEN